MTGVVASLSAFATGPTASVAQESEPLKKRLNDPVDAVREILVGMGSLHPSLSLPDLDDVIVQSDFPAPGVRQVAVLQVAVLSGGGAQRGLAAGQRVVILFNGLGGTPPMELAVVARRALATARREGLVINAAGPAIC